MFLYERNIKINIMKAFCCHMLDLFCSAILLQNGRFKECIAHYHSRLYSLVLYESFASLLCVSVVRFFIGCGRD